jgi:hypothetical protein
MRSSVFGATVLTLIFFATSPSAHARVPAQVQCVATSAQTVACRTTSFPMVPEDNLTAGVLPNVEAQLVGYVEYNKFICWSSPGWWTIITPPSRGTTRTQIVFKQLDNGDCPGIEMPFNVILYTWTSTEKNIYTDAFDATWQASQLFKQVHFDITLGHVEVTLASPPAENKYVIPAAPAMPAVKASAKVVGLNPDPTPTTTFTWTANLKTKKGSGGEVSHKAYIVQDKTTTGTAEYTLELTDASKIIGGELSIDAKAVLTGATLEGGTPNGAAIIGTNPPRANIQARVDLAVDGISFSGLQKADVQDALKKMGCQESRQRQFKANADGGTGPALISFDDGVGTYQITSDKPLVNNPSVAYDWRANVDTGAQVYSSKAAVAKRYPSLLRARAEYKMFISETVNPARCDGLLNPIGLTPVPKQPVETYVERCKAGLGPIAGDAPAADFTKVNPIGSAPVNQLLEDGVRGYNGFAGPKLFELALHEFRPDSNFLVALPDVDLPTLPSNTAIWQRVPPSDRGSSGDPNYVANVTSKSATCN